MGTVNTFNKDEERKLIFQMLKKMAAAEKMNFGSVSVSYELKYKNGKPYQFLVKDPIENSLEPKSFG